MSTTPTSKPARVLIPMTQIIIDRQEGPVDLCKTCLFTSFKDADAYLKSVCQGMDPKSVTYNKCAFKVCYADGDEYEGRFDACHPHARNHELPDLGLRVRRYLEFVAGLSKPDHMTADEFDAARARRREATPQAEADAIRWLKTYALVDLPRPTPVTEDDGRKAVSIADAVAATVNAVDLPMVSAFNLSLTICIQQCARTLILMDAEVERLKAAGQPYAEMLTRALTVRKSLGILTTAKDK